MTVLEVEGRVAPTAGAESRWSSASGALEIRTERAGTTVLMALSGVLDSAARGALVEAADLALDEPCRDVIVCLREVTSVDAGGLRALLAVRAACAGADTLLHIVHASDAVTHLLETEGLQGAFA
jgi:anti-anti-sigma factor